MRQIARKFRNVNTGDQAMAAQKETKVATPAYVTYRTFTNSLDRLRERGVPNRVDSSVFVGQSGSTIAALLSSYKFLKLTTDAGAITPLLRELVNADDAGRAMLMREALEMSYPFLQPPAIDLAAATTQEIEGAFREQGIAGSTVTKAVSFFLSAATAAGIEVSKHVKAPTAKRGTNGKPKRQAKSGRNQAPAPVEPVHRPRHGSPAELLLGKFPDFDPAWPDAIKEQWFTSFSSLRAAMLDEEVKK
jgi:hypothetical protein